VSRVFCTLFWAERHPALAYAVMAPLRSGCAEPLCGGTKLSKIGEDVTETLDVVPPTRR
jgi:hypothetical protein